MWGRVRAVASLTMASLAFSCQAFVDGEIESFACSEEGRLGPPVCPEGQRCIAGVCAVPDSGPKLGDPCETNAACGPGDVCLVAELAGAGGRFCSRPCCTSGDCGEAGEGFVCGAAGSKGPSFCRRAADVGVGALGGALAGDLCKAPDECRSGRCEVGACRDTCCSDTNCASGEAVCRVAEARWECGPATGVRPYLEVCESGADCASGLCIPMGAELRCSTPCCDSAACGSATLGGMPMQIACREIDLGAPLRACSVPLSTTATGLVGVPCDAGDTCRSGLCDAVEAECTDACCKDADCGDEQAFACVPRAGEAPGTWVLRCAPKY